LKYSGETRPPVTDTTPRHRASSRATDDTTGPTGVTECADGLLHRGEAALAETERAAAFRARGDLRTLRRLAERTEDPAVRERATAVVDAFDRLRRAVWETPRAGTPND